MCKIIRCLIISNLMNSELEIAMILSQKDDLYFLFVFQPFII